MIIAIDFDGTCVTHDYPEIGKEIGAIEVLKELLDKGHELILFTMRSGKGLHEAVQWFNENDIRLYGVQYNPTQAGWTCSNKAYANMYIDDAALGCPLIYEKHFKPYADWKKIREWLKEKEIL